MDKTHPRRQRPTTISVPTDIAACTTASTAHAVDAVVEIQPDALQMAVLGSM